MDLEVLLFFAEKKARAKNQKKQMYKHDHGKDMSSPAIAQMLSAKLYYKRFFPYYTFNILGGLDENGTGKYLSQLRK